MPKCRKCDKKSKKSQMFLVVVGKSNQYYCNETEYLELQEEKRNKQILEDKIFEILYEILGEKTKNSELRKQFNSWTAKNDVLLAFFEDKRDILSDILAKKQFDYMTGKIRYLSAIVNNHIDDYKKEYEMRTEPKMDFEFEYYTPICKPKKQRKCIQDYINEYGGDND